MFPDGDMSTMLAQAQALQQQLAQAQDELARTRVDGSASGGLVTATVTGAGELLGLVISPAALAGDDPTETAETVADLVLAAVRDATSNAAALAERAMAPLTENLGGLSSQLGGGGPALAPER